jgi:hypothetical protein
MIIFILWVVGFVICLVIDHYRYESLSKRGKTTGNILGEHFGTVLGYITVTVLLLIWFVNKRD